MIKAWIDPLNFEDEIEYRLWNSEFNLDDLKYLFYNNQISREQLEYYQEYAEYIYNLRRAN